MTGVLADRIPADLHLFRNYDLPGMDYEKAEELAKPFKATPKPAGTDLLLLASVLFHAVSA